jgi:enoyl-CoA hydratase/carnithine racemase
MTPPVAAASGVVLVERHDAIAIITINRPEKLNALNADVFTALRDILDTLERDESVKALIFTGQGDKAFVAGADIEQLARMDTTEAFDEMTSGHRLYLRISEFPKPTIAMVNGYALGGGFEMALACDIIVAADSARLGLPEPRVGLMAGAGGVHRLPRMIPQKIAMGYILTGRHMTAQEAHRLGVVNEVVPRALVMPTALKWANEILECAPLSIRASKQAALMGLGHPLDIALKLGYTEAERMRRSEDTIEGPRAFAEKRKPNWKAR